MKPFGVNSAIRPMKGMIAKKKTDGFDKLCGLISEKNALEDRIEMVMKRVRVSSGFRAGDEKFLSDMSGKVFVLKSKIDEQRKKNHAG
jgi:hypothetical protein